MARTGTVQRLRIELSDVDRGVYESLDMRLAQHPSETPRRVLLRAIAFALSYEDGIEHSRESLCDADTPAIAVRDAIGIAHWIDVDAPSAERLKRACTAARRVTVFACGGADAVAARAREVPRGERAEVLAIDADFLDALAGHVAAAGGRFTLVRSGGHLFATCGDATIEAPLSVVTAAPGA